MKLRRLLDIAAAYALIAGLVFIAMKLNGSEPYRFEGRAYVIDGDTVVVEGQHLRLAGIDAPELEQSCRQQDLPVACGRRAREALRAMVAGVIRCESVGRDRYQRWLARCEAGSGDIGARMVAVGEAIAYGCCWAEEAAARKAHSGLWAGSFEAPATWRHDKQQRAAETTRDGDKQPLQVAP